MATGFGAFAAALAGALLMRSQPSWRVAPISDETARRVRPLSWFLAGLAFASILIDAFNQTVGASQAAIVTTQALEALLHLLLIGAFLLLLGRLRAERAPQENEAEAPGSAGLGLVTLVAWLFVGLAAIALLVGFIGFSIFLARLMVWALLLGSLVYLLMCAADDMATSVFSRDSRFGQALVRGFGLRASLLDQFGLLLSAGLRIMLVLVALGMLLSPFGAGGVGGLFGRLGTFANGIDVAGISISPGAILRSIVVLVVGLALVRGFMGWLEQRYLPATDLDGSGRNSVSLIARYVGLGLAAIWALASLGIGVERIALLLSALSVGIGFGLQAITQNFVSGLILLAERPIKIGDWVRVGTDEGDVKRISVRSTEIALADHSTLIVPNSELITKSVLNKTLGMSLGRIQVQFSILLGIDTARVRQMVLDAFVAEPAVLEDPAPAVFIDSITDGRVLFNCFAHVASPRDAYGARSNVLMTLLNRFRAEGIDIGTVPQRLEIAGTQLLPAQPPK
jgi:small-conductance mechanosensitive channel